MSGISPRPDQQTDSETILLRALDGLSISSISQAVRKSGISTFANTSAALTVETPPEVPDGIRTTFTITNSPKWISVDGLNKFVTTDYTYVTGTLTITNGSPPVVSITSFY